MPTAHAVTTMFSYRDHDSAVVLETPPVLNQWYTVFDDEDVRLLWCVIYQKNDEAAAKNVEIKWTIDGTVYDATTALNNDSEYFAFRSQHPAAGYAGGLFILAATWNAAGHTDKRGQRFKVEVRITSALGTNQTLICRCVYETLEAT